MKTLKKKLRKSIVTDRISAQMKLYRSLSVGETMRKLQTTPEGLDDREAERRGAEYGYNRIEEKTTHPLLKLLSYFWGPIPWMIEIAGVLSGILGRWEDTAVIAVLLLVNVATAFWEEYKASSTIAALKKRMAVSSRVKRNGNWIMKGAEEIVPGDILRLRIGDIVPADVKLLAGESIQVDQSALTGEAFPVVLSPSSIAFSGSIVKQGEIDAVVYATGMNTYFGQTTHLVKDTKESSHFQKAILRIGNFLIVSAFLLIIVILTVSMFRGIDILTNLQFSLILLVAAIPVAMPTVLSITMAIGARALAKKKVIVSHLSSIEELAGIDILCSDKTGTLTRNKLTVGKPFVVNGYGEDKLFLFGSLASRKEDGDAIDTAVIESSAASLRNYTIRHFSPFDPVHKRTEAHVETPEGKDFYVTKGAPQVILDMSSNREEVKDAVGREIRGFAAKGYRSLGVAYAEKPEDWQFAGIIPLYDPLRRDSRAMVDKTRKMGIEVKMITGDHDIIAGQVAGELGLGGKIMKADGLLKDDEEANVRNIEEASGVAQVYPEHKYTIVDLLKQHDHIVGMTGDGVNDAPALKKADVGIAVSGSTDAARSAADIILLRPGLSVIIDAIRESRKIFSRMTSYATYRIAESIRILLFMTMSILAFNFYPVTAIMIVLIALLNDGAIVSIAYDRATASRKPEHWHIPELITVSSILGVMGVAASFLLFYIGENIFHLDRDIIRTLIYLKLSVAGHLTIFITRTKGHFWTQRPSAVLFWAVVITQLVATLIAVYGVFMMPLGWGWALIVWGYAIVWFIINDIVKAAAVRVFRLYRT
ncbi:MAG: plasma-membrane proton-efflux P-type ATPase [Spirochaetales bacterium]|nr:plasma-membrane proton-efflux P-type ATPase [Spirochaetales bacterium]